MIGLLILFCKERKDGVVLDYEIRLEIFFVKCFGFFLLNVGIENILIFLFVFELSSLIKRYKSGWKVIVFVELIVLFEYFE